MSFLINPYRFGGATSSLLTDLVAWWSLDEASGTRVNNHNSGTYDLTDVNTVTQTTGVVGSAADFVASNSELLYSLHNADLQAGDRDFTVCGWANVTSSSDGSANIVGKPVRNAGWCVCRNGTGESVLANMRNAANTANVDTAAISITYSTWFFFLMQFTASSDELSLEINRGTPQTATVTGGSYTGETSPFAIGAHGNNAAVNNLHGSVDEVALWHRLLTTDEKDSLYNSGGGMAYPG